MQFRLGAPQHGGVAHLVERLAGSQEVVSSILIASTKKKYELADRPRTQKVCHGPHRATTHLRRSILGKDHDQTLEHHHAVERHTSTD